MKGFLKKYALPLLLLLLLGLTACGGEDSGVDSANHDEMEGMEGMDHDQDEMSVSRIPNENGAAISIVSPANNSTFSAGEQVIVEVSTENFPLGDTNNHWHVYVDGASWGMIMGGNSDFPLNGLEPGEHEMAVYMSIESHEEYEDGDAITILIEE